MPWDASLIPLEKAVVHNQAVLANANWLANAISPITGRVAALFRVQVFVSLAGVFSAIITRGGVAVTGQFNLGVPLAANAWQQFDLLVHTGDTVNFQTTVAATVSLRVQEIYAGAQ